MIVPPGLLLAFLGDDFTGSTDAMEVMAKAGFRSVLFLEPPSIDWLRENPDIQVVGVAGVSRSWTPAQLDANLPARFEAIRTLGARINHMKICSTFDSSPQIGSIGRTIEIGQRVFGPGPTPVVVGSPDLGRYVSFGNLFARAGGSREVYRLDRHPTMTRHPVTPMHESDLRIHLAAQTDLPILSIGVDDLGAPMGDGVAVFDTISHDHLRQIGARIWSASLDRPGVFVVGSNGVETAIVNFFSDGELSASSVGPAAPVGNVFVASGSCSPATRDQIDWAEQNGYLSLPIASQSFPGDRDSLIERSIAALRQGRSVVVHTCKGPDDQRLAHGRADHRLSESLAEVTRGVLDRVRPGRLVLAGGDTSGAIARSLGIASLEMVAPLTPGSPICRASAGDAQLDGLEIVFKGGQIGPPNYFEFVQNGQLSHEHH